MRPSVAKKVIAKALPLKVKRGIEILSVFNYPDFTYHGTIVRHGRTKRSYSFHTKRGRVVAHNTSLEAIVKIVRKLHKTASISRITYGGR